MPDRTSTVGKAFARRLLLALRAKGWTANRLSRETGIPYPTVNRWKNGKRGQFCDPVLMWSVAQTLACDYTWLLTGYGVAPSAEETSSKADS